ncbi:TOMM precursor leader peptide-binding protein [Dolichospermum sp. LEGE 00240]|jgi:molybdopterin-synthase adenylyltransferase|uniref:TOMM precursor leader peptide-binding protein n=1 Tax=Dolichospermum sp. LEGE 00240 TaxID=1828603 RepID=UPI0018822E25|nr:TOMM precursor leader peptide-binding protein [Dolichospermum sp. LEGE 00240]MBE9247878.1 TOMM precursor leader peptide-binding protein [Dolichospermum sp. LEGE 00240]MDM3850148.1 TOMM precursor leader peptide-binding protein [Aphanizomenon gracile PMC627.10]MDM3855376.1 TOMM precursor leader peptide-binding protein [Aphanizomenon gracile PMC649.10]
MKLNDSQRLRLLEHVVINVMPADCSGEESMIFNTTRRTLRVQGQALHNVEKIVLPLLDGDRTIGEIRDAIGEQLTDSSLNQCLEFLMDNRLVEESWEDRDDLDSHACLLPQISLYHELGFNQKDAQKHLANARIAVFGLGGSGLIAAINLATAGIGFVRLCDDACILPADSLLSGSGLNKIGAFRGVEAARQIEAIGGITRTEIITDALNDDATINPLLEDVDLVIVATDAVSVNLAYRLNRLCLKMQRPLLPGGAAGIEGNVGPLVFAKDGPCYLCYRMRSMACSKFPEAELAVEQLLNRERRSQPRLRENLPIGQMLVGSYMALDAVKMMLGLPMATDGKLLHIDLLSTKLTHNVVLKKPGCPHCSGKQVTGNR